MASELQLTSDAMALFSHKLWYVTYRLNYFVCGINGDVKQTMVAQWALESSYGQSRLAQEHNNFSGMKYRDYLKPYGAKSVKYEAHDGVDYYCSFNTLGGYILCYISKFKHEPYNLNVSAYNSGDDFIRAIGPLWVTGSPKMGTAAANYINKINKLKGQIFTGNW